MTNTIILTVAILACSVAQAQPLKDLLQSIPIVKPRTQPIIDLGEVVINVVVAKVQTDGSEAQLLIAKFGGLEANAATSKAVTTNVTQTRMRTVIVDGKNVEQAYTAQVPVTAVVQRKENFTPTEQQRSIPVGLVQAFDLTGKPVDVKVWTKRLENPTHVLLLKEPMNESNHLNPFYASLLREDTLLLFLESEDGPEDIGMIVVRVYEIGDFEVWRKGEEDQDPNVFFELVKSKVTPAEWTRRARMMDLANRSTILVAASATTHRELAKFFKQLREDMNKANNGK